MPDMETFDIDTGEVYPIKGVAGKTVFIENDSGAGAVVYITSTGDKYSRGGKNYYPLTDGSSITFEFYDQDEIYLETDTNDTTVHIIINTAGRVTLA